MSTRCNIIIKKSGEFNEGNPNNGIKYRQYYRHYDGYLTGAGLDLVLLMNEFINDNSPKEIKSAYNIESWLKNNLTHLYEIEGDKIAPHGDIEYLYLIDFDNGIKITVYKRNNYENSVDDWEKWSNEVIFEADTFDTGYCNCYRIKSINITN